MSKKFQIKRGLAANLPTLAEGEFGFCTNSGSEKLYIGTASNGNKEISMGTHTHSTYATKASPTFTGTPKAPTAAAGNNSTQIATTAFVQTAVASSEAFIKKIGTLPNVSANDSRVLLDLSTIDWSKYKKIKILTNFSNTNTDAASQGGLSLWIQQGDGTNRSTINGNYRTYESQSFSYTTAGQITHNSLTVINNALVEIDVVCMQVADGKYACSYETHIYPFDHPSYNSPQGGFFAAGYLNDGLSSPIKGILFYKASAKTTSFSNIVVWGYSI